MSLNGMARCGLTKKLSHAAKTVNRECGTEDIIGVGSDDLLGLIHGFFEGDLGMTARNVAA
jgi:hypothetical protein